MRRASLVLGIPWKCAHPKTAVHVRPNFFDRLNSASLLPSWIGERVWAAQESSRTLRLLLSL